MLGLTFIWDSEMAKRFDIIDPATGNTINMAEIERQGRLAERQARIAAEERERELIAEIERLSRQSSTDR